MLVRPFAIIEESSKENAALSRLSTGASARNGSKLRKKLIYSKIGSFLSTGHF